LKLHKLLAVTLATASLLGGTLASTTPAMAKAKKFVYYQNAFWPVHKEYKSMNKYTINKTLSVRYSSKLKIKHLYVFHVSPMNSRYQTWVKVTGSLNDKGTKGLELSGKDQNGGYYTEDASWLTTANAGNIPFFSSVSSMSSALSHDKSSFELLYHIANKTGKLGKTKLNIQTVYRDEDPQYGSSSGAHTNKTLNLNLK